MSNIAAFFDLDKTVISRSSVFAISPAFYREGLLTGRTMMRGVYRQILYSLFGADEDTMESARSAMLELTKGWEQDRIVEIVNDVLEGAISPIVYEGALELIDEHKRAGHEVFIVSSSPREIVEPLAGFVGVNRVISTVARVEDGRYTGELEFYSYGPYKADKIHEIAIGEDIDLKASFAYSDSITDLPMLECVGNPTAVNPDRALRRIAGERHWDVVDFQKQVMLRSRIPTPPLGPTVGVAASVAVVGVFLWWYRRNFDELPGLEQALVRLRMIRPRRDSMQDTIQHGAASLARVVGSAAKNSRSRLSRSSD